MHVCVDGIAHDGFIAAIACDFRSPNKEPRELSPPLLSDFDAPVSPHHAVHTLVEINAGSFVRSYPLQSVNVDYTGGAGAGVATKSM